MNKQQYNKGLTVKVYSLLIGLILSVGFTSCTDWLDVKPESDQVLEEFWKNESHANQVLAACYRSMLEYNFLERAMVWGELRSDNVTFGSTPGFDMIQMINVEITSYNGLVDWAPMYRTINYCNTWLHFAPGVMDLDPNFTRAKYQTARAEVLAIRSLVYFYLVRTFRDVPLVVAPSIDDTQDYYVGQSTEDQVLDYITADLEDALLSAREAFDVTINNKGRITKNTIRTLLADIALWRNDYQTVVNYCDQVLASDQLALEEGEDVLQNVFFVGNSLESIFELQYIDSNITNGTVRDILGWFGRLGKWRFPLNLTLEGGPFAYEYAANTVEGEEDIRKYDYLYQISQEDYFPFKYVGLRRTSVGEEVSMLDYSERSDWSNWVVYRLSDIYLMKAEALVEIGGREQEALDLVNLTFLRSNPDLENEPLQLANYQGAELRALVLRERQREFLWEGKRWFDLMRLARRNGSPEPLLGYVLKKFGGEGNYGAKMSVMEALYLPVIQREINANPALQQNPFYETNSASEDGN